MIVAVDHTGGYANGVTIPWSFEADLKHFKKVTAGNACIMGRKTYDDIANKRREQKPNFRVLLPYRTSYVISKSITEAQGAEVFPNVSAVLETLPNNNQEIYLLGGSRMWIQYLNRAKQIWMTIVPGKYKTNKKFPIEFMKDYEIVEGHKEETDQGELMFVRYVRKVTYYTIQVLDPTARKHLVEHFKERLIKTDSQGITFVEPQKGELKYVKRFGITKRQGLAIE
ncbi:hypothetical protein LCGC14_1903140 [marine sediment metagenome]|uniref:dihydrofolate reductase n=1 Tax=marine sediment metagenome TaxID=412755 RepID=A0A0F9I9V6_9ZZZZ